MNEQFSAENDYDDEPRESDRIRQDIDRTLYQMSDTVEQIQEKLQPRALLNQARSAVMSPAGIIGLGIAWLVVDRLSGRGRREAFEVGRRIRAEREWAPARWGGRRGIARREERLRDEVSSMTQHAREKVADVSSRAGDAVHSAREAASDLKSRVRDRVTDKSRRARARAALAGRAMKRGAQYARDHASDIYEENPLAVGAAALAAGIAGGLILPTTQREDEFVGRRGEELIDRARGVGREVLEAGREAVRSAREGQSVAQRGASAIGHGLREAGEEVQGRAGLGYGAAHNLD